MMVAILADDPNYMTTTCDIAVWFNYILFIGAYIIIFFIKM